MFIYLDMPIDLYILHVHSPFPSLNVNSFHLRTKQRQQNLQDLIQNLGMLINALIYGFLIEHELKWARKK